MLGWALAASGEAGLKRMLELMDVEIRTAMGLMGVTSLAQLNPSWVRPTVPVRPASQTNAYPLFEEQRAKKGHVTRDPSPVTGDAWPRSVTGDRRRVTGDQKAVR